MARSYAAVFHRIWADPEWRALDVDSQHLYLLLISQPTMNLAGVLPLQPRRWTSCVADWDVDRIEAAMKRLRADRFLVVDEDTEEVLVRTLIRNDGAYRTPGMLRSLLKSAEAVQSPELRATLCLELGRLDRLEGKKADENMALIAATRLALMPHGTPPGPGVIHRSDGIADGIPDAMQSDAIQSDAMPDAIADTSGSGSGSGPLFSYVDQLGGKGAPPSSDEPPTCPKHTGMAREEIPACWACGRARERWQQDRANAAKGKPLPPLCGECDDRWIRVERGYTHCPRCHPAANRKATA